MASPLVTKLLWLGGLGVAGYAVYRALEKKCAADPSYSIFGTQVCGLLPAAPPSTAAASAASTTTSAGSSAASSTPPASSPSTDVWANAAADMQRQAGGNSANIDQWAWYWAHGAAGSSEPAGYGAAISSALGDEIIKLAGGDRTVTMTAEQWLQFLQQARTAGFSGFGFFRTPGISAAMIHGFPYGAVGVHPALIRLGRS